MWTYNFILTAIYVFFVSNIPGIHSDEQPAKLNVISDSLEKIEKKSLQGSYRFGLPTISGKNFQLVLSKTFDPFRSFLFTVNKWKGDPSLPTVSQVIRAGAGGQTSVLHQTHNNVYSPNGLTDPFHWNLVNDANSLQNHSPSSGNSIKEENPEDGLRKILKTQNQIVEFCKRYVNNDSHIDSEAIGLDPSSSLIDVKDEMHFKAAPQQH